MNLSMLLEIPAAMHPDRIAVSDDETEQSFAELTARAAAWGAWMSEMAQGRPIGYLGGSRVAFVELLFGAAYAGCPLLPLNYRVKEGELAYFLEISRPHLLVAEDQYHPLVAATGADVAVVQPDLYLPAASAEAPFDAMSPAVVLFTSGTTAQPKPTMLTHGNLTSFVLATVAAGSAGLDESVLLSVPPYHIAGVANVLSNVHRARRIVLLAEFDPRRWLEVVRDESITHAFVVPTMLVRILDVLKVEPGLAPVGLQTLAYGGSRAPEGLVARAMAGFPREVGFVNAFGLTETSSTVAVLTEDDHRSAFGSDDPALRARLNSAGRPIPGIEVAIVDEEGRSRPTGTRGEIWLRGAQIATERIDPEGWLPTRDLGSLDAGGFLFIHGRLDDVIIRGGENVIPAEIETVLEAHPAVVEAAVVGVEDREWGQIVGALVVGKRIDNEELQLWVRERLAGYKVPTVIRWCEELPRNDMGKVVRRRAAALVRGR